MNAFSIINSKNNKNKIILDSGASEHYTPIKDWLIDYKPINNQYITVANGTKVPIKGIGNIPILLNNNKELIISKVHYIPNIESTLISSKELTNKKWSIFFNGDNALITHNKLNIQLKAIWEQNAYYFNFEINKDLILNYINPISEENKLDLIHQRLNHINRDHLIKTINNYTINKNNKVQLKDYKLNNCESCYKGKMHIKSLAIIH